MDFLSEKGLLIYEEIKKHSEKKLKIMDADRLEMAMLANSFDLYFECASYVKTNGVKFTITTEKGGTYEQICPEYTVMKSEYANILKHAGKFGLNPGDRERLFKKLTDPEKEKPKGAARFIVSKAS